jgi:hypothetical protein
MLFLCTHKFLFDLQLVGRPYVDRQLYIDI